jgi:hypothetical protein
MPASCHQGRFIADPVHQAVMDAAERHRTLHGRYRRETNVQNGKSWETLGLEDFAALRKGGLPHQLMDEIERQFGAPR